ncbi:DUF4245 domain-containing protein [Rhodococcus rhodnii]|uniref:DUF4245 domain-containing protein n=1 Tax=Rhodococcus rhodnii TaxID=38312 RepID=UPI0003A02EEB|nr:DUF4245 domain-containing protein [Rhodococcus rhodnii]
MASDKPRILQGGRDMLWSLLALGAFCVVIAAIANQCTLSPGGPTAGPVPSFDMSAGLQYDAQSLDFPIREPVVPDGWQTNSGSRAVVAGDAGGDATTVGFIDAGGRYLQYTQSSADELPLVGFVAGEPRYAEGSEDIAGRTWVVYGGQGVEPIWVADFGQSRILISGSAGEESFVTLATAVENAPILEP